MRRTFIHAGLLGGVAALISWLVVTAPARSPVPAGASPRQEVETAFSTSSFVSSATSTGDGILVEAIARLHNAKKAEPRGWALEIWGKSTIAGESRTFGWRRQYIDQEFLVPCDVPTLPCFAEWVPVLPGRYDVRILLYEPTPEPLNETWLEEADSVAITTWTVDVR